MNKAKAEPSLYLHGASQSSHGKSFRTISDSALKIHALDRTNVDDQNYGLEEIDFGKLSNFIVANDQKEIVYEIPDFEPMKFLAEQEKKAIRLFNNLDFSALSEVMKDEDIVAESMEMKARNTLTLYIANELFRHSKKMITLFDYMSKEDCKIKIHYFKDKPSAVHFNDYPREGCFSIYADRDLCRKFEAVHAEEFFTAENFRLAFPPYV